MGNQYHIFINIFLCLLIQLTKCSEFVPVYMWKTTKTSEQIPALHKISEASFEDALLEQLKTQPYVVVFAEHTLSPEDFAQRNQAGEVAFPNLSNIKKSAVVSYKPYVQNPINAVKQINREVTEVPMTSLLQDFNVPKDNILIVDLNDAKDDENRFDMLKRHDSDIVLSFEKIKKTNNNVLAIYTAYHTSWVAPEEAPEFKIRNLLADNDKEAKDNTPIFFSTSEVLFALTGDIIANGDVINKKDVMFNSSKNEDDNNITVTITASDLTLSAKITPIKQSGYWTLTDASANYSNVILTLSLPLVEVPNTFSYHCGNISFSGRDETSNKKYKFSFPGFQIYPFIYRNESSKNTPKNIDKFPDAYDCVGFTTVPIWSGIFVTFILLSIMTFGLTMMMDIRTMDRFDDSKGKTIVVNASE